MTRHLPAPSNRSGKIIIERAAKDDIPRLVDIFIKAFQGNPMVMLLWPDIEEARRELAKNLEQGWDNHRVRVFKAVDKEAREIAGSSIWVRSDGSQKAPRGSLELDVASSREPLDGLKEYLKRESDRYQREWVDYKAHWYLASLSVDPSFQRRGIGSLLVKTGTDLADEDGFPCYLLATPEGHVVYKKLDWHEVGVISTDISKYISLEGAGFGIYCYWPMLRLSNPCAKGSVSINGDSKSA